MSVCLGQISVPRIFLIFLSSRTVPYASLSGMLIIGQKQYPERMKGIYIICRPSTQALLPIISSQTDDPSSAPPVLPNWSSVLSKSLPVSHPTALRWGLVAKLHRNSAYRCRFATLASLLATSGRTDKTPVLIQSCRTSSVRSAMFLAPIKSACSVY